MNIESVKGLQTRDKLKYKVMKTKFRFKGKYKMRIPIIDYRLSLKENSRVLTIVIQINSNLNK